MGESVKRVVAGYIEELEGKPGRGGKPVTFSIRLSEREHRRLVWLAENLGAQKTPLAEKLLKAALDEAIEEYAGWASVGDPESLMEGMERAVPVGRGSKRPGSGSPRASVSGTVTGWKANHHGDTDGFYLEDGSEVGFPPHRAAEIQAVVRVGADIEASGDWRGNRLHAYTITDTASGTRVEAHRAP